MSQPGTTSSKSRWRFWLWLGVWSFLAATVTVYWQAGDHANWLQDRDGKSSLAGLAEAWLMTFILVLMPSYVIVRAWRYLPRRRMARIWLGLVSVAGGILWCSFLMEQAMLDWRDYSSPPIFLTWILIWSVVFLTGLLFLISFRDLFRRLCSWRMAKRGLLAAVFLCVLAVTFYAEENWRGRRAWENYRREWEAKGEKFELSAFAPPAVADEQNFALAPIVVSCYAGRLVQPPSDDDNGKTNLPSRLALELQRTNLYFNSEVKIGAWQQAKLTDLAAWQNYYRTRFVTNSLGMGYAPPLERPEVTDTNKPEDMVESVPALEFPIAAQPQSPAADVLLALSRYETALAELRTAASRPVSRFPLNYRAKNPIEIPLPHLRDLKRCATVLQLRALAELSGGQTENALADVKLMLRLAEHLRTEPFLISQLARMALVNLAVQPVWEGLAEHRWSETQLRELQQAMQPLDFVAGLPICLRAEQASDIGCIESLQAHRDGFSTRFIYAISPRFFDLLEHLNDVCPDLPDPCHNVFYSLERALMEGAPGEWIDRIMIQLPPAGWYEWNKVSLAKRYQEQIFQVADPAKHFISRPTVEAFLSTIDSELSARMFGVHDALACLLGSAISETARKFAAGQNAIDMTQVACALERHRLAHGEYPENLAPLVPAYLPTLPPDVVDGQPLHYRRLPDGRFLLYSIGWNGKDDGGAVVLRDNRYLDPKQGDWVWQYPAN